MTREYLRLLTKRCSQWLFLVSLLVIQGAECLSTPYGENAAEAFMSIRSLNKFGLLFTPLFCLWNTPVYQVCRPFRPPSIPPFSGTDQHRPKKRRRWNSLSLIHIWTHTCAYSAHCRRDREIHRSCLRWIPIAFQKGL